MATNNAVNTNLSGQTGTGNFAGATSPTFVTPTLGAATATSLTFNPTTNGIVGTTTNNNAAAGSVGEVISSTILVGSAVSFTSTVVKDLTSISLTAGDWDVHGSLRFAGSTSITSMQVWISSTSATAPDAAIVSIINGLAGNTCSENAPFFRASLSGTTTIYISGILVGTGTLTASGFITARRVR